MTGPVTASGPVPCHAPADLSRYELPALNPFLCSVKVTSDQISTAIPHVSNVEYLRWLDRAAELHCDALGFSRARMTAAGHMWFVVRHELDYLAEAWLDDEIVIATWIRDLQRVKSWRESVILRPRDEQVICRAATLWVLVDLQTRRPHRLSPEMIDAFQPASMRGACLPTGRTRS